jgi:glycerate dehydrogenase
MDVAQILRRSKLPVILVANKADNNIQIYDSYEFYKLGLGDPQCISAATGSGTGDLLDMLMEKLPATKADDLEHLLRTSDVLTLHCPLNADTTGMINAERLAMMKQGAIVLNMARGALIVEQDLADALNSGHLYAAAIDCTSVEPPAADHPLLTARNCYITPHIGWTSLEARVRLMNDITSNAAAYINGKPINVVN